MTKRRLPCLLLCALLLTASSTLAQALHLSGREAARHYDQLVADIEAQADTGSVIFDDYPVPLAILEKLKEIFPSIEFEYSISLGGKNYRSTVEQANIYRHRVTDQKQFDILCKTLAHLPNLKELTATNSILTFAQLERLRETHPQMHVSANIRIGRRSLRTSLTAFSTRHAYYSTRYTSDDFRGVKYCDNLMALDIGHNAVTDLNFLYDVPNLRILIVADNQITDLTPIASLRHLEYLEIFKNPVTDLSPLARLENLIDLNMTYCQVEDYTPLLGLKKLDRLWFGENPYTDEDLQMLRDALPGCTIQTDCVVRSRSGGTGSAPTANGWRQGHPRYLQIVRIFDNSRYEEFGKKK